jgi:spore germination protein
VLDTARVHIVRAGETLYQIAARYGLTVPALIAANDRVAPERLLVGMELAIPLVGSR